MFSQKYSGAGCSKWLILQNKNSQTNHAQIPRLFLNFQNVILILAERRNSLQVQKVLILFFYPDGRNNREKLKQSLSVVNFQNSTLDQ